MEVISRKALRVRAVLDRASAETSDVLSPEPFMTNNNVSFNENSLGGAGPAFVNIRPDAEELMTTLLPETADPICAAPNVDDAAVSR